MSDATVAVILAGGLARRMGGGDKSRLVVGGRTVLARTVATIAPQVSALALNANGDPARFADLALPVLPDAMQGHPGPLAGILAGLDWAQGRGATWLLSVPGDCPFLPDDLLLRLHQARIAAGTRYACAASGGWTHPVVGLWPVDCRDALGAALEGGQRKIDAFTARGGAAQAEWPVEPLDPFFNLNTPDDLARADTLARRTAGPLFYEDLHVGQTFASGPVTMDRDRLVAFAAEFDPQPQHLGEASAVRSQFGTLVASGWHTAALTMRLQLEAMMGRFPGGALGAQVDTLTWRRPVHPGDSLHVVVEVLQMRPSASKPGRGILTLRTTTLDQHGEAVMTLQAAVLVPRRSLGSGP